MTFIAVRCTSGSWTFRQVAACQVLLYTRGVLHLFTIDRHSSNVARCHLLSVVRDQLERVTCHRLCGVTWRRRWCDAGERPGLTRSRRPGRPDGSGGPWESRRESRHHVRRDVMGESRHYERKFIVGRVQGNRRQQKKTRNWKALVDINNCSLLDCHCFIIF